MTDTKPEKLKMHSPDLSQDNIARIRELFPGCVTEAKDANGKIKLAVDFDQLRQELSDSIVEGPQERYHLNWPGKREALLAANAPIAKTLRPCREESVDFDTTKNLFIEGDNLDALKLLQETYLGQVKMIYIDPPYNTGNEFLYEDDFKTSSSEYFHRSGQEDELGVRTRANSESNGRFHSDWLSMLYPRLKLARNLLRQDGAIFVSIDDNEVQGLRQLMDEVYGAGNFIATIIWQKNYSPKNSAKYFSTDHDYVVLYARDSETWRPKLLPRTDEMQARYSNPDNDPRGQWKSSDLSARNYYSQGTYSITCPSGRVISGPPRGTYWRYSEEKFKQLDEDKRIWWGPEGNNTPSIKRFLSEVKQGRVPQTIWSYKDVGHTQLAKRELLGLVDFPNSESVFQTPKPEGLIERMLKIATEPDTSDIVMDFFAGSGTTAQAVLHLNQKDNGNRRFILVQLPELTGEDSFPTIADIAKARLQNLGKKLKNDVGSTLPAGDVGFRYLVTHSTNMQDVYYSPDQTDQKGLLDNVDNIKPDRTPEDLLFQVLLDWGVDLTLSIRQETLQGKTVFFVNELPYDLIACFDTGITEELVTELAGHEPLRVVFRDNGFATDALKINITQIFKQLSPVTEVKVI